MTTTRRQGQMKLGAFFHPTGHHVAAWLHPDAQIDAGTNFRHYARMTQAAERAKFDLIFLADSAATRGGNMKALRRWPQYMAYFEPTTLLSGLAALTENIGLVATATTSFNEPYNLARRYASLDHISGGRAGWNVVTSSNKAEPFNYGQDKLPAHSDRYGRAREFVEVVKGLWDSWEDDAFLRDREQALYFDPDKLHTLDHHGQYFDVRGPLNVARPPQGYPVLVQAGASDAGRDFAAETAEIVFTAQTELAQAKAFHDDLKARMARFGRAPDQLKIMPGLNPIIGRTEEEAREKHAFLQSLIHPDVGRELLSPELGGVDLSEVPVDEVLPENLIDDSVDSSKSTFQRVADMARKEKLTVRQMYERYGGARGQRTVIGTPAQIADQMEEWFLAGAVDGFLIQPAVLPTGLDEFAATVIPELQRRGLFRTEYEGSTLRENLGLHRPAGRYAHQG
jgi:alkanesulfonate monooxygenase